MTLFEGFTLRHLTPLARQGIFIAPYDRDVSHEALEGVGPDRAYEIVPHVREDAIAGYGPRGVTAKPRRVALSAAQNKDAIGLLIDYAESFKAAQEAVRKRNLEKGFAVGWACYVLFPTWEQARTFARTYVEKDVITQIIDAVGIAENAFNEGLVRGFRYGEKHSKAQLDLVRQRALNAIHKGGLTVEGTVVDDPDDPEAVIYNFVDDDVYLFAGALLPAAREVIEEAERRKEEREEREAARIRRENREIGNRI